MAKEFQKLTREEWSKLTPQERENERHLLKVSQEKYRRLMLLGSRILALLLVASVFWVGFSTYVYKNDLTKIYDEYGKDTHCYLCGVASLKSCSCVYYPGVLIENINITAEAERLGFQNVQECESYSQFRDHGWNDGFNLSN